MKALKLTVPTVVLLAGVIFSGAISFAKPEYTKKEKKSCVTCHVTASSKELNDAGKCYGKSKTLEGCEVKK